MARHITFYLNMCNILLIITSIYFIFIINYKREIYIFVCVIIVIYIFINNSVINLLQIIPNSTIIWLISYFICFFFLFFFKYIRIRLWVTNTQTYTSESTSDNLLVFFLFSLLIFKCCIEK